MTPTFFATPADFRAWLATNHTSATELIMGFHKKATGRPSITWAEAVDEALCYGWIDGIRKRFDDEAYTVRFTPRKPKSGWSKVNTRNVERLITENRMQAAGLTHVEAAKADGRWEAAYHSASTAEPAPDFLEALAKHPKAQETFASLKKQEAYAIYYRLQSAKRPETRERRLAMFIAMLARGEKPKLW
jgi:uncharacterized protein YdeI (YjbR/CyaY-like superfamily)